MNVCKLPAIKNILLSLILTSTNLHAASFSLEDGKARNQIEKEVLKEIYSRFKTLPGYLFEFEDENYFALSKTANAIGVYDLSSSESKLHGWPLSRWKYYADFRERQDRMADYSLSQRDFALNVKDPLGCLSNTPLRYGDIESDGDQELVLFLGNDLVAFSPSYQRIVFSANLSLLDWMNASDTEFIYTDEFGKVEKAETEPQYASSLANTFRMIPGGPPGYRGYAKIFQGDFDKDGAFDLVVWQKIYESKLENDSQRGFTLLNNYFMHYKRDLNAQAKSETGITGEYLPQDTDQATIQTWLSENKLTWSKGFPSVSECEGEEGKLIPEMHDPLLNDPDVLQ